MKKSGFQRDRLRRLTKHSPIKRMGTMPEKQHAHELIERLPDSQVATAIRFLESMLLDAVAHTVDTAPLDDEPVSEQDRLRFHNGQAWFRQHGGKGIPMDDVLAECDLKPEDFPHSPEDTH